jgi:hypothetical protein
MNNTNSFICLEAGRQPECQKDQVLILILSKATAAVFSLFSPMAEKTVRKFFGVPLTRL